MLALVSDTSHKNGVVLGPHLVYEHGGEGRRETCGMIVVVKEPVGRLCPLEQDVGPVLCVDGHEPAVQSLTLVFEHTHRHLYARLAQLGYAASVDLGKRIDAAHDHATHAFPHDEVGTWRRLAVMRTRLQTNIHRASAEQRLITRTHRRKGVDLGMALATTHMVALAYYPSVTNDDGTDHGVGLGILTATVGKLKAATHIHLVDLTLSSFLRRSSVDLR